jgi:hypothetical protein
MDALWSQTQTPAVHERWDLRFSRIEYLPRIDESAPQRFQYATRIGFGVEVSGEGETVGRRDSTDGSSTSALKFGSEERLSIIREGSGYWRYIPTEDGVRFLTWYDYETRFGTAGAYFDRLIFRPLIGWATAWSFDRLRLWLEQDVAPEQAIRQSLIHTTSRVALAAVFIYHGLIREPLTRNVAEIAMVRAAGVAGSVVTPCILELSFAAALLVAWHRRWPLFVCLALMLLVTVAVGINSPRHFDAPFNPFTLNFVVACLASIDIVVVGNIPSAARCLRRPGAEKA